MSATLSSLIWLGRAESPLRRVRCFQRTGAVDERLEGTFGDLFGERPRRVMGTGRGTAVGACDVPPAGLGDRGQAELVEAEQAEGRGDPHRQFGIDDGALEPAEPFGILGRRGEGCLHLLGRPARAVGEVLDLERRSLGEGDLGVFLDLLRPLVRALQAEHSFGGGTDLQFEEALVDVADLFHVQGTEREAAALAAEHHILHGASIRSTVRSSTAGGLPPRGCRSTGRPRAKGSGPGRTGRHRRRGAAGPRARHRVHGAGHGEQPMPCGGALPRTAPRLSCCSSCSTRWPTL